MSSFVCIGGFIIWCSCLQVSSERVEQLEEKVVSLEQAVANLPTANEASPIPPAVSEEAAAKVANLTDLVASTQKDVHALRDSMVSSITYCGFSNVPYDEWYGMVV